MKLGRSLSGPRGHKREKLNDIVLHRVYFSNDAIFVRFWLRFIARFGKKSIISSLMAE